MLPHSDFIYCRWANWMILECRRALVTENVQLPYVGLLAFVDQNGSLYFLDVFGRKLSEVIGSAHFASMKLWNRSLFHVNYRAIFEMVPAGLVKGVKVSEGMNKCVCESCIHGKAHRSRYQKFGNLHVPLLGSKWYIMMFVVLWRINIW